MRLDKCYDIYEYIQEKRSLDKNITFEEMMKTFQNSPTKIPNNPLLTNYEWVYEHVEEIFIRCAIDYQQNQGIEQYYTFFKALTNKYSVEEDYLKYLKSNNELYLSRWHTFASKLLNFIGSAFDERLEKLLEKKEVMDYLKKYPALYDNDLLASSYSYIIAKFLEDRSYHNYYINNYHNLILLIRKFPPNFNLPTDLMLNEKIIKDMSRTHHIEDFYFELAFIKEKVCVLPYLDEHIKYCDEQVSNIKNGILPFYEERHNKSKENIELEDIYYSFNNMEQQVIKRIFEKNNCKTLPKTYIYQELSKYMLVGMYMSRNFETDPYNLLIDIETLYSFAIKNNIQLKGMEVYKFLIHFESFTIGQIIDLYNKSKSINLKEILYDDWNSQKENFINELNSKMLKLDNLKTTIIDGIECYDITDIDTPILVHNTAIPIDNIEEINRMIDRIKKGYIERICLSVHDENHNKYYEEKETKNKKTIKFAYGPLEHNRVGIVNHTDAYSLDGNTVEVENFDYKRNLYTLSSFMEQTKIYNEINYVIEGHPFLPIGIICDDVITEEEIEIAKKMNLPIIHRKLKETEKTYVEEQTLVKKYSYVANKKLF
jgi:hypothetical protein